MTDQPFRIAIVEGVMPGKWVRTWERRFPAQPIRVDLVADQVQTQVLLDHRADMAFVRLPVDVDGLHVIPLYEEVGVVVVPKDHVVAAFEEVALADLADELQLEVGPELTARQAVETVAAGTGVLVTPMSVARLHHRKDVTAVPVVDAPRSAVGLAWLRANDDPRVEELIGIVRGRTERSSRGPGHPVEGQAEPQSTPRRSGEQQRGPGARPRRHPAPRKGRRRGR